MTRMCKRLFIVFSVIILFVGNYVTGGGILSAQTYTQHFGIRYVINRPEIDTSFLDNADRTDNIRYFLETLRDDSLAVVRRIWFKGTASPDGGLEFNQWLSVNRLRTFSQFVNEYIEVPDSMIISSSDIPWDEFRDAVEASDITYRDEVLEIIDQGEKIVPWFNNRHIDARLLKLKKMHNGAAWEELKEPILRDLRYGKATIEYLRIIPLIPPPIHSLSVSELQTPTLNPQSTAEDKEIWIPRLHLKTNVVGWVLFSANVAVEVDLTRHLSVALPIYYCGMDWFKSTIKFRNFSIQPELRFWPRRSDNDGFFVGAHFGLSYYNFAFDGDYRYQDYRGKTPAIGGGLSVGYRLPISKDKRWRMEFAIGAGIYPIDYSIFANTPDVRDGAWLDRQQKLYIGLDQTAITFAYSFDMNKFKRTYPKKVKKNKTTNVNAETDNR